MDGGSGGPFFQTLVHMGAWNGNAERRDDNREYYLVSGGDGA